MGYRLAHSWFYLPCLVKPDAAVTPRRLRCDGSLDIQAKVQPLCPTPAPEGYSGGEIPAGQLRRLSRGLLAGSHFLLDFFYDFFNRFLNGPAVFTDFFGLGGFTLRSGHRVTR